MSIFASIFLEMFANVEFRNSFWSKLVLDALGLSPNGNEFFFGYARMDMTKVLKER